MICDLKNVRHMERLESIDDMKQLFDNICDKYNFTVLGKLSHIFTPQGLSVLYMLSESHISVHTFPENRYLALDIYTCREYADDSVYMDIYSYIVDWFQCDKGVPVIVSRGFA
jgi:S-adenosylmethionine decarboxylase